MMEAVVTTEEAAAGSLLEEAIVDVAVAVPMDKAPSSFFINASQSTFSLVAVMSAPRKSRLASVMPEPPSKSLRRS